jgi:hypothetical protein
MRPLYASRPSAVAPMAQAVFLDEHAVQLPEIAVTEKSADHVRRNQLGADRVKLVSRRELKTAIGAGQGSLETGMEKARAGLNDDHSGSAAVRIVVGQPEEGHGLGLLGHPAVSAAEQVPSTRSQSPGPCRSSSESRAGTAWGEIAAAPHTRKITRPPAAAFRIGVIGAPSRIAARHRP